MSPINREFDRDNYCTIIFPCKHGAENLLEAFCAVQQRLTEQFSDAPVVVVVSRLSRESDSSISKFPPMAGSAVTELCASIAASAQENGVKTLALICEEGSKAAIFGLRYSLQLEFVDSIRGPQRVFSATFLTKRSANSVDITLDNMDFVLSQLDVTECGTWALVHISHGDDLQQGATWSDVRRYPVHDFGVYESYCKWSFDPRGEVDKSFGVFWGNYFSRHFFENKLGGEELVKRYLEENAFKPEYAKSLVRRLPAGGVVLLLGDEPVPLGYNIEPSAEGKNAAWLFRWLRDHQAL